MQQDQINWAINVLTELNYILLSEHPKTIQENAWSTVCRFDTNKGSFFLKVTPPALFIESKIIKKLAKSFHAPVPKVIAESSELNCFLMKDAGIRLHDYFKNGFQLEILAQAVNDHSVLQMKTIDSVESFIKMGVPDWRLNKLPILYQDLISQETILTEDGLTSSELKKLANLNSKLVSICEQLANFKLTETFSHADFHDKNILVDPKTHKTTIIDLGEVVITHPFFSLPNCLHRAKEHFALTPIQDQQLLDACLKPWLHMETEENLKLILTLMQQCWPIHAVLGEYRLMQSVPDGFIKLNRQGRFANALRYWLSE